LRIVSPHGAFDIDEKPWKRAWAALGKVILFFTVPMIEDRLHAWVPARGCAHGVPVKFKADRGKSAQYEVDGGSECAPM